MLLALSDDYWMPFVKDMAELLDNNGMDYVIVSDSRAGEYQSFGSLNNFDETKCYYFSDFDNLNNAKVYDGDNLDVSVLFSDYYRLFRYGAYSWLRKTEWVKLLNDMGCFLSGIFEKENIGIVVHDQVSTSFSYVAYELSKSFSADYIGLVGARVPYRYEIRESIYNEDKYVESIYKKIISGEEPVLDNEKEWASDFITNIDKKEPSYMEDNFLNDVRIKNYVNFNKLKSFLRKVIFSLFHSRATNCNSFRESPVQASFRSFKRNVLRLYRKRGFRKFETVIDSQWLKNNHYYVYPIHYQPEASTSISAHDYVDQYNMILNIAFNLPKGFRLLVKEHRSAIGYCDKNFYRDIALLPNVLLVSEQLNIKELIRGSEGVITLTSTAAFEALIMNKKAYMFGDAFYSFHSLCEKLDSWKDLKNKLRKDKVSNTTDNIAFLVAYYRYTRPGLIAYKKYAWGIGDNLLGFIREKLERRSL